MQPPLIRHGQFLRKISPTNTTDQRSKNAKVHKPVTRYRKSRKVAESVHAFQLIKKTYEDAIEYRTIPAQVRGIILLFGCIIGAIALWFGWAFFSSVISDGKIKTSEYFLLSVVEPAALCGVLLLVLSIRLELFRPIDEPVIFDRKHRKVYLIARAVAPGVFGMFKSWPIRAYEYDWDLVDAEHQLTISTTGSTVTTWHALLFTVRNSASDNRIIGTFTVANPVLLGESTVGPFWEHIRRFMEEDGLHLPPGEARTFLEVPTSLWQSMGAVGPFGPNYFHWWKTTLFTAA